MILRCIMLEALEKPRVLLIQCHIDIPIEDISINPLARKDTGKLYVNSFPIITDSLFFGQSIDKICN